MTLTLDLTELYAEIEQLQLRNQHSKHLYAIKSMKMYW